MNKKCVFTGVATALATPFDENGRIDFEAFGKMIDFQLASGVDAVVVCGTTGEASTLTRKEKRELTSFASERINKKVPLIAGTGGNDTLSSAKISRDAARAGADALLLVTPYYNKCTQSGLIEHYKKISDYAGMPFIAYNIPARTGMRIEPETAVKIAELPLSAGIKDAGGSISDTARTISLCGDALPLYSGNDDRILPVLSLGGKGVISVVSNILPQETKSLCSLFFAGKVKKAAELQMNLLPLVDALFSEVNPIPLKFALAELGYCKNVLRPPLTSLSPQNAERVIKVLGKKITEK